jgi:hypothetical protein
LPALVFATQSPFSGWQTVANSRTLSAMCQLSQKEEEMKKILFLPEFLVSPWRPCHGNFVLFGFTYE